MTMIENFYHSTPAYDLQMHEWVHSERYEYCEDFYESYTNGKIKNLKSKVASILTSLFI